MHRISINEADFLFDGTRKKPEKLLNFDSPDLKCYQEKLRAKRVTAEEMKAVVEEGKNSGPHHEGGGPAFSPERVIEQQRIMLASGFKQGGKWEMEPEDIVLITDQDEIPTVEGIRALSECDPSQFEAARRAADPKTTCATGDHKVVFKSQILMFYFDCPTAGPGPWWHPDAIPAECVTSGEWNLEQVRERLGGVMTEPYTGRHLHNFALSDHQLTQKYKHYNHPCAPHLDAMCHEETWPEVRWRTCEESAPPLGPDGWYTQYKPEDDFRQHKRMSVKEMQKVDPGVDVTEFRIRAKREDKYTKNLWREDRKMNEFVTKPRKEPGTNTFKD